MPKYKKLNATFWVIFKQCVCDGILHLWWQRCAMRDANCRRCHFYFTQKRFALIRENIAIVAMYHQQNMYSSWQCRKTSSSCSSSSITFCSFNVWCAESLVQQETKNANGLNVVVKFIDKKRIEGQGAAAKAAASSSSKLHPPLQLQKIESHQKRP